MTLEGLLSFLAVLVAIMALVDPVGRRSLSFLVPWQWLVGAAGISAILLLARDVLRVAGLNPATDSLLSSMSFVIPATVGIFCVRSWQRARLPSDPQQALDAVYQLVRTALLEGRFTEVERVLRANESRLRTLTDEHTVLLFDPRLISAFLASGSSFHLELLADLSYIDSLPNRFATVHGVVRALLVGELSPLRSVIVERTNVQERYHATRVETELIDQTFGNPEWYLRSSAYYALVVAAVQEVESCERDATYNAALGLYGSTHGRSTRTRCPIFMAEKTIVFALEKAIVQKTELDCYVMDLHDLFRTILAHSDHRKSIWNLPFAESPTPYAYLLTEIVNDLRRLAEAAIVISPSEPGHLAQEIAQAWSFCVWSIADPEAGVSPAFRNERVSDYLTFVLQLGWQPGQFSVDSGIKGLERWRDLFAHQLRARLMIGGDAHDLVMGLLSTADTGKEYARLGREWLRTELERAGQT